MKTNISLYPRLDINRSSELFKLESPIFYYTDEDGNNYDLTKDGDETSAALKDPRGNWSADKYDLKLKWKVSCSDPSSLYGVNADYAVACHNAKIGLALQWYSKKSHQRGTVNLDVLRNIEKKVSFDCIFTFQKALLRGTIGMSLILYIKECGIPYDDEYHFANTPGLIIGELGEFEVYLDGNGSFFPIYEISQKGGPLWSVHYDMAEPESDDFSESISVNINKMHPCYPSVDRNNKEFNNQLFIEIISHALGLIIETVRTADPDFNCLENAQSGSVAEAILYFRDQLEWDLSSPINLSKSIMQHLENRVQVQ